MGTRPCSQRPSRVPAPDRPGLPSTRMHRAVRYQQLCKHASMRAHSRSDRSSGGGNALCHSSAQRARELTWGAARSVRGRSGDDDSGPGVAVGKGYPLGTPADLRSRCTVVVPPPTTHPGAQGRAGTIAGESNPLQRPSCLRTHSRVYPTFAQWPTQPAGVPGRG